MTPALALHPLFAGISSEALASLERYLQTRRFDAGDIILRAGVPSAELFGLIDGAVRVELAGGGRRLLLLPPQCFGELSALTGDPVSANVVAQRDVRTWVLSAPVLLEAMAQEVAFFRNVATLLGLRLRERTRRAQAARPRVVLVPTGEEVDPILLAALARGLQHYAPGSEHDESRDDAASGAQRIRRWRDVGPSDAVLLLGTGQAGSAALLAELDADDALLVTADDLRRLPDTHAAPVVWRPGALSGAAALQRWCHAVPRDEIDAAASSGD